MPSSILGIETATDVCSVAISRDDVIIAEASLATGMRHSSALTGLIKDVVDISGVSMQELAAIAISDGPGSYTGLRVGASTAKALCYALDIPLIAIPTLEALGMEVGAETDHIVLSTLDARRMEVYALIMKGDGTTVKETHAIIWTEEVIADLYKSYGPMTICGTGVEKVQALLNSYPHMKSHVSACDAQLLLPLAQSKYAQQDFVDIAYHDPFYYKSPNITQSKKRILP